MQNHLKPQDCIIVHICHLFLQGRESDHSERVGRTIWALLSEVPRAKPSRAKQRWEGARDLPKGERHGAAEEREPGELLKAGLLVGQSHLIKIYMHLVTSLEKVVIRDWVLHCTCIQIKKAKYSHLPELKGPFEGGDDSCTIGHHRSALRGQQGTLWTRGNWLCTWKWEGSQSRYVVSAGVNSDNVLPISLLYVIISIMAWPKHAVMTAHCYWIQIVQPFAFFITGSCQDKRKWDWVLTQGNQLSKEWTAVS